MPLPFSNAHICVGLLTHMLMWKHAPTLEFDNFHVLGVRETDFMKSIWTVGRRGIDVCKSMIIRKLGYLTKLRRSCRSVKFP
jgi:hypothetical protein